MRARHRHAVRALILSALAAFAGAQPGTLFAATAQESFADGNRLYRDKLYWAALLRYEQAANAGMDSPLLHYNTGVAHYKARQYRRAAAAFEKAALSPRLEVLSHYNLGLTAYADNDNATALRWFRKARDQQQNEQISELAVRAIDRIRRDVLIVDTDEPEPEEPRRDLDRDPRPFSEHELYARVGFGSDSNVYRSPGSPYVDQSDPNGGVPVDPIVQSGAFVPVRLGAKYLVNSFEHESFFARYRGQGRFYTAAELTNANEFSNELAIGTEYRKQRGRRENRMFSAFTIAAHDETFYDPDTGEARQFNGSDISDRYSYLRYGPEIWTRQSWERFSFRLWGKAQLWNYENTGEVPEYDHEYFNVGAWAQYRFTSTSLLRVSVDGSMRNFSDRPSFSLDGTQAITNETVNYTYVDYGVLARQRLGQRLWFGAKYVFRQRKDGYVGYNDYRRNGFGGELHLRIGEDLELDFEALYQIYDFINAYAYNNLASSPKTLETADANVRLSWEMPWNLRLIGSYRYRDVTSNDARIAYQRNLFQLGIDWTYQ